MLKVIRYDEKPFLKSVKYFRFVDALYLTGTNMTYHYTTIKNGPLGIPCSIRNLRYAIFSMVISRLIDKLSLLENAVL